MSLLYTNSLSSKKSKISSFIAISILCGLFFIPYQEIRIERIRSFGENKAVGIVIEKIHQKKQQNSTSSDSTNDELIRYRFVGPLGQPREHVAKINHAEWERLSQGDNILVYYAKAAPRISRVKYERESSIVKILAKLSRTNN